MSILDRLNQAIAARIHQTRPRIVVEGGSVVLLSSGGGRTALPLNDLTGAALCHRDVYAGDAVVLRLEFADGQALDIVQDDPCWFPLMEALDRSGMIPTPSTEWQLRFLAMGDGAPALDLMNPPRP
jgi:hypothetical protein